MKNRRYDLKHRLLEKGESQRLTGEFKVLFSTLNDASFFTLNGAVSA